MTVLVTVLVLVLVLALYQGILLLLWQHMNQTGEREAMLVLYQGILLVALYQGILLLLWQHMNQTGERRAMLVLQGRSVTASNALAAGLIREEEQRDKAWAT